MRRLVVAGIALAAASAAVFGILAPPERCPAVDRARLRRSASEAVGWFVRNQQPDGRWLYLYEADTDTVVADYNVVRHAGAAMGLYQAAAAGIPGALESADRGVEWALDRLLERDGWAALDDPGHVVSVGATALLTAGLVERRILSGDDGHDALLRRFGRFLSAQVEPSGAVLAYYDPEAGRPLARTYSQYYTGEAYWALARLHRLFPDGSFGRAAERIGTYLAIRRDDAEDLWPPLADHWAAYGLAETVAFPERGRSRPLTADEVAYARRQAGLLASQVRWVSQRFGPWGRLVRGPSVPRGGGYGVLGEGLTGLWRVTGADPRLADLHTPVGERAVCIAALAVRAQSDAAEAAEARAPGRVRGAWLRDDSTRMDDQQHAISALLRTDAIVTAADEADEGPGRPAPSAWLWWAALVAGLTPLRAALAVPRSGRSGREAAGVAALGALLGSVPVLVVALAGDSLLDALDVSQPAARIAAGVAAAAVGVGDLLRSPPSAEPALPGRWAAVVPVAVPLVARPALVPLALSAGADHGAWPVVAALAVGGAALVALALRPPEGVRRRVLVWAGRVTAAVLVGVGAALTVDGVFDV